MNQKKSKVTRRNFLAAGSVAAASTVLAGEATAEPKAETPANSMPSPTVAVSYDDPVTTNAVQTLTNKTISAANNNLIVGANHVNIRESPYFPTSGNDITDAINWAINKITTGTGPRGGQILIPRGLWRSNGGHLLTSAVSIEGEGFNIGTGLGTEIWLNGTSPNTAMFIITGNQTNCSLKNMLINMYEKTSGIGLLIQNPTGAFVYQTYVGNVCFASGAFGIKVDHTGTQNSFECILNRFERVSFLLCRTGFYCNSVDGGYDFNTCYFRIPTYDAVTGKSGICLDVVYMGNLSLNHCLFVGSANQPPNVPPTDGTIILRTTGGFNNICFNDCQDENIEYAYRNANNYWANVPLVYRNCIIQSKLKFTASGSVVFDSCGLNGTLVYDSENASVRVQRQGFTYVTNTTPPDRLAEFVNPVSHIIDEYGNLNPPVIYNTPPVGPQVINASRGVAIIPAGASYVQVFNVFMRTTSIVLAQLRSYDPSGANITIVQSENGYFIVYLNQTATVDVKVGFQIKF